MAQCKSCHAEIRWAISDRTGKPMPIDVTPTENGNLYLYPNHGDVHARAATADDRRLKRELFTSHFATCPQAAQWRQPKQGE